MESWASSPGVAKSMRSNRRRDTTPELALRKLLHAQGYRYRVDYAPLQTQRRRRADIVFTRWHLAVFVDGCFWHGCPLHATHPVTNREYWDTKLARNIARDAETTAMLEEAGWAVLRFWEHTSAEDAARCIRRELELMRSSDDVGRMVHDDEHPEPVR